MMRDIWSVILIVGLIGWIFSSIMLLFKSFPQKNIFVASSGIKWGTSALVSFLLWLAGLLNA
jgi:hypothetical protein